MLLPTAGVAVRPGSFIHRSMKDSNRYCCQITGVPNILHCSYSIIHYVVHLPTSRVAAFMMILHSNHVCGICILSDGNLSISTTAGQTLLQHCRYRRVLINICKIENQLYYDTHNTRQLHMCITYIILSVITHGYENHKFKVRIIVTYYT